MSQISEFIADMHISQKSMYSNTKVTDMLRNTYLFEAY